MIRLILCKSFQSTLELGPIAQSKEATDFHTTSSAVVAKDLMMLFIKDIRNLEPK